MNDVNTSTTTSASVASNASEGVENIPAPLVVNKDEKFSFRKPTVADKVTGEMPEKRSPVTLTLPIPTWEGFVTSLRNPDPTQQKKMQDYVLSLLEDAIVEKARQQVSPDDTLATPVNKQDDLDISQLTLEYLANEPKIDRRGRGIAKEVWEAFVQDYVAVMPGVTGMAAEKVALAAMLFRNKLVSVKTQKEVLMVLEKRLLQWIDATPNLADYEDVAKYLTEKLDTYLKAPEQDLLANL